MEGKWVAGTLGDIADLVMGQSPAGNTCNDAGLGVPLLNGPTEFGGNHPRPVQFTTDPRKFAEPDDLLFCVRGSTTGRMNWADQRYAIGRGLAAIRPKEGKEYRHFVRAIIDANLPQLLSCATGSTFPNVSRDQIQEIECSIPPLRAQRAIAHVLGTLDDKIELNRRMNKTLEEMARALFKSWFVDFDPVRAKMAGKKPDNLDPAIAALFPDSFQESELGPIPRGWGVIGLPEAIDFLEGPGLRNWQYRDKGMKFLNIRCIGDGELDIVKANCISCDEFEKTYRHFALQEDDVVISTSGTLGRLAIVRADHLPVMLNTSIIRMRGRGAVGLGYVWGFLQAEYFLAEMHALAAGSVQLNFGPMHLRQISILRPPDRILGGFERAAQSLLRKGLQIRKESRTLATLRDTLLPKLLSGELSVGRLNTIEEVLT